MSVSDLITDLPLCSPLIFDGSGQWKGHRVVLWDLTQNDSMVRLNPIENSVTHSQMPTEVSFIFMLLLIVHGPELVSEPP